MINRHIVFSSLALILLALMPMSFSSCLPESPYNTDKVTIQMQVNTVSAGFCEVRLTPYDEKGKRLRDAYYYADMVQVVPGVDLDRDYKNVMNLLLDSVYMRYIQWRHDVYATLTPFVADFASHSLYYDQTDEVFTFLNPGTDYWLIAFVVDPENNTPVGKPFYQIIHTKDSSEIAVNFDIRVSNYWTYFYPNDPTTGRVLSNFPYLACTMDSLDLLSRFAGDTSGLHKPAMFFLDSMQRVAASYDWDNTPVLFGISVNTHDGSKSGLVFQEGHTYYSAVAGFDGGFTENHRNLVKFVWNDTLQLNLTQDDAIGFVW